MATVTKTLPGFIGGVSQQSPTLRLETQCEASDNSHVTIAEGLMQRPNSDFVNMLDGLATDELLVHKINRDVQEKYLVTISSGLDPIKVYDLDGNPMTVRYGRLSDNMHWTGDHTVTGYLSCSRPSQDLKAITVADYTIITNRTKTVRKYAYQSADRSGAAYVWVKRRSKGEHSIRWNWTENNGTLGFGGGISYANDTDNPDTEGLAQWFADNIPQPTKISATRTGSVIRFYPTAGGPVDPGSLRVTVTDPYGGRNMIPINYSEVDSSDKLPAQLPADDVIKVYGDKESGQDDYYLHFNSVKKVWHETVGWGMDLQFDVDTMPHRLVRTGPNEFTFSPIIWEERTVGDDETNGFPSFQGNKISGLTFHKNRLWFLSNDNIIGSKAGDYFNFFGSTVMDVLDDDPIDVAASSGQVATLRSAIGFDKGLLVFSDEEQFALTSGEQALTSTSVAIDPTTAFPADVHCKPVKIGPDVYFISPKLNYLSVREYAIQPDTLIQDAFDVTSHVPNYIPKGDVEAEGCAALDLLFVHTSAGPKALYIHKFLWDGNEKVQQAWYRWTFHDAIVGFKVFQTELYVIFRDSSGACRLEKIRLENTPYGNQPFRFYLDSLIHRPSGSYNASQNVTTYTVPLNCGNGTGWTVVAGDDQSDLNSIAAISGTSVRLTGNHAGRPIYVGRNYTMRHRLSEFYARDQEGKAILQGRLQLRRLLLSFKGTGSFKVEITPFQRNTLTHTLTAEFSGIRVGETKIGAVSLLDGEQGFLVMAKSKQTKIEIVADSYLPVALQTYGYEATFNHRGRII